MRHVLSPVWSEKDLDVADGGLAEPLEGGRPLPAARRDSALRAARRSPGGER